MKPEQTKVHITKSIVPILEKYARENCEDSLASSARKLIKIGLMAEGYLKIEEVA